MPNEVTFFGHSAFRITTEDGLRIWIDPWLDNPMAAGMEISREADLLLITHAHGDHLGNAVEMATSASCEVVAIHEIQQYLLSKGLPNVTGMNIGGTYVTKGVAVTMTTARHSSSIQEGNELRYGGEAAGFVVTLPDGKAVYHAGDTGLFSEMALIGQIYQPDLALLPIGSHYVMDPREAAHACRLLKCPRVVPMHYGSFPVLTGTPEAFQRELEELKVECEVVVLQPGESCQL